MANIKSAKKRVKQDEKARQRNIARRNTIRTAIKKTLVSIDGKEDIKTMQELLSQAEAQIARAKNKGLLHPRTASRKVSRLAKKIALLKKSASAAPRSHAAA